MCVEKVFDYSSCLDKNQLAYAHDINTWGNRVDGLVGAASGRLIRWISWFSLNNEAIAEIVETAFAVAARKGAEEFAYCHYVCDENEVNIAAPTNQQDPPAGDGPVLKSLAFQRWGRG